MKIVFAFVPFIAVMVFAQGVCAQIGQAGWGVPHHQGLVLLDTCNSEIDRTAGQRQRFWIVTVRNEAILLDTATGETWRLVFPESENTPLRWEPIHRPHGRSACLADRPRKRADQKRTVPSNQREFNPFHPDTDEPHKRPTPDGKRK